MLQTGKQAQKNRQPGAMQKLQKKSSPLRLLHSLHPCLERLSHTGVQVKPI